MLPAGCAPCQRPSFIISLARRQGKAAATIKLIKYVCHQTLTHSTNHSGGKNIGNIGNEI